MPPPPPPPPSRYKNKYVRLQNAYPKRQKVFHQIVFQTHVINGLRTWIRTVWSIERASIFLKFHSIMRLRI
jgi:hypothetical protein